ncbi:MAG: helix-hairpin-helix domain-containing protein [Elusimicrobiota bacterium]
MSAREYQASVSGVLAEIRFHKEHYLIGRLADGTAVKGGMVAPQLGLEYSFQGRWVRHPRWGDTFVFSSYTRAYPKSLPAIRSYLEQNARWVGPETSQRIVSAYGEKALDVLKAEPERVAREIPGITPARALEISAMLKAAQGHEELEIALNELFEGLAVSARVRHRILDIWGPDAPARIKQDPYQLIEAVGGVGFLTADKIARRVGFEPEGHPRIRAGVLHALNEAAWGPGHTFLPKDVLLRLARELLAVDIGKIEAALPKLAAEGVVVTDGNAVYLQALYRDEKTVAHLLKQLQDHGGSTAAQDQSQSNGGNRT